MDTPPLPKYTVPPGQFKCPYCQTDTALYDAAKELRDAEHAYRTAAYLGIPDGSLTQRVASARTTWSKMLEPQS